VIEISLKHITGFSKLFANREFSQSWKAKPQIQIEKEQGVLGKCK